MRIVAIRVLASAIAVCVVLAAVQGAHDLLPFRPRVSWAPQNPCVLAGLLPDGGTLLTIDIQGWQEPVSNYRRGPVRLWNATTGEPSGLKGMNLETVYDVRISPDGEQVAVDCGPFLLFYRIGSCETWPSPNLRRFPDYRSGSVFRFYKEVCRSYALSPDWSTLACSPKDSDPDQEVIELWDVAGQRLRARLEGGSGVLVFSPDGRKLASGSRDKGVWLWDVAGGRGFPVGRLFGLSDAAAGPVLSLAFSPDGKALFSLEGPAGFMTAPANLELNRLVVWDIEPGLAVGSLTYRHFGKPTFAYGAFGFEDSTPGYLWGRKSLTVGSRFHPGEQIAQEMIYRGPPQLLPEFVGNDGVMSANNQRLAMVEKNGPTARVRLFDVSQRAEAIPELGSFQLPRYPGSDHLPRVEFSPDGKTLVMEGIRSSEPPGLVRRLAEWLGRPIPAHGTDVVKVVDALSGKERATIELVGSHAIKCSPDGKLLATLGQDHVIRIWNIPPDKPSRLLIGLVVVGCLAPFVAAYFWLRRRRANRRVQPAAA